MKSNLADVLAMVAPLVSEDVRATAAARSKKRAAKLAAEPNVEARLLSLELAVKKEPAPR